MDTGSPDGYGRKNLFVLMLLVAIATAVVFSYVAWSGYKEVWQGAAANTRNLAAAIEARLDAALARTEAALEELAAAVPTESLAAGAAYSYRLQMTKALNAEHNRFPELFGLYVLDADSKVLYRSDRSDPQAVVGAERSVVDNRTMMLSRALPDGGGVDRGTVVALLNLRYFEDVFRSLNVGQRGMVEIRKSDDFRLVSRWPQSAEMANNVWPEGYPVRQRLRAGEQEGVIEATAQADGVPRIIAFHVLGSFPYVVSVVQERADLLAPWNLRMAVMGTAIAALLGAFWFVRGRLQTARVVEEVARQRLVAQNQRLQVSEAQLGDAMDMARTAYWEYDVGSDSFLFNDRLFALFRTTADDVGSHSMTTAYFSALVLHADDVVGVVGDLAACVKVADPHQVFAREMRLRCGDGAFRWVAVHFRFAPDAGGAAGKICGAAVDIDAEKHAEEQLRLLANVFEQSGEAILVTDAENRIVSVNEAFTHLTGYGFADVRGENPRVLSARRTSREEYQAMWASIGEHGGWHGEIWDRRKDGSCYPKWLNISTLRDSHGNVTHYIGSFTDISERKAAEQRIRHLAHHDTLTGLPNRFSLHQRLEQAVAAARRDNRGLAVLFIDLDRFKAINDSLGHPMGDRLLIEVANRLRDGVRESDVVARLGGDEFVVVMTDLGDGKIGSLSSLTSKILRRLSQPYTVASRELHSTPSIGISVFPSDGGDVDTLMKHADMAMYHAKAQGRANFQFFAASMNEAAAERAELESDLRRAIDNGELLLHFQPQIDAVSGRTVCVEALVRWQHPQRGMIAPDKFIPLAEETGLIEPLGRWVLDAAGRQLWWLSNHGCRGMRMAVNLSARQLRQEDLVSWIEQLMIVHQISPGDLELEITESVAMENPESTIGILRQLRELGVTLAIDDFGTGYSSLAYLKLLPIQRLKLDRSFVSDIESDHNDAIICSATIALAHSLGLEVVAEGVETEAQHTYLQYLGCDLIQGYYFSRPLPADRLGEFLGCSPKAPDSPAA